MEENRSESTEPTDYSRSRLGNGKILGKIEMLGNGERLGNRERLGSGAKLGNGERLGDGERLGNGERLGDGELDTPAGDGDVTVGGVVTGSASVQDLPWFFGAPPEHALQSNSTISTSSSVV